MILLHTLLHYYTFLITYTFFHLVPVHLRTSLSFDEIFGSEENIDRHLKSIEEVQRVIKAFNVGNGHGHYGKQAGNSIPYVARTGSKNELVQRLREIVVERVPSAKAAADAKAQEAAKAQAATNAQETASEQQFWSRTRGMMVPVGMMCETCEEYHPRCTCCT